MTIEELTKTVIQTTHTKPDIHRRLRLVREYLECIHFKGGETEDLPKFLSEHNGTKADLEDMPKWGKEFFQSFTKQNLYDLLKKLSDYVKVMPFLSLYLPYDPNSYETAMLGSWLRKNVHPDVIIEIHVDPTILGGCAFVWNGFYRDYSLGYYLRQKNKEIRAIFEKYENYSRTA